MEMGSERGASQDPKEEEEVEDPDTPSIEAVGGPHPRPALHHLTRHWLPEDERGEGVLDRFGAPTLEAARHMVRTMGQRELRAAFQRVYGSPTQSFNNNWLRRKLLEALGLRTQPAGRSTPSGQGRPRREKKERRTPTMTSRERPATVVAPAAPAAGVGVRRHQTRAASAVDAEAAATSGLNTIAGAIDLISPLASPLRSPIRSPGSGPGLSPQGTLVVPPNGGAILGVPQAQLPLPPQQQSPLTPRLGAREPSFDAAQTGAWLPAGVPLTPRGPESRQQQALWAQQQEQYTQQHVRLQQGNDPGWRGVGDLHASEALAYYYQQQVVAQQREYELVSQNEGECDDGPGSNPPQQGPSAGQSVVRRWDPPHRPSSTPL